MKWDGRLAPHLTKALYKTTLMASVVGSETRR